jgi:hypothetical protein
VEVHVAEGLQPAVLKGAHLAGVVDLQPGSGFRADGFRADVFGQGLLAGGEQHLVGLQLPATFEGSR